MSDGDEVDGIYCTLDLLKTIFSSFSLIYMRIADLLEEDEISNPPYA